MNCTKCELHKTRTNIVLGHGNKHATLFFIGEAPGYHEDQQGKPFVGAAGKIFSRMLDSLSLTRDDIYLTNIVKCRPPKNRNPTEEEIDTCSLYLDKEIAYIKPKILIPMGTFAMSYILSKYFIPFKTISQCHGIPIESNGVIIYPVFHPAAIIYNRDLQNVMNNDMKKLKILSEETKHEKVER